MKVFIGLSEIAGRNRALKAGFESLGHSTTFINLSPGRFGYGNDNALLLARMVCYLVGLRRRLRRGPLRPLLVFPELFFRFALFVQVLVSHDVFVFSAGSSFFRYWDYRILAGLAYWDYRVIRLARKKLICQFHGSDSRPPYLNGAYVSEATFSIARCAADTATLKQRLRTIDRWASAIIDNPPQGYFHDRPYYIRLYAGLPSGPFEGARPVLERASTSAAGAPGPVRILHAPSNSNYKGTSEIREIVQQLRAKSFLVEFIEIQDKSNREVIAEIQKADLVVDQLYCDYALNGLPTEALWWGKPVLSGGYSSDQWAKLLPAELLPPVVYCHPSEFPDQLERLVADSGLRRRLAIAGYAYVRRFHHPRIVAENYLRIAAGTAPIAWTYDPREMKEVWGGFFMSEEKARQITGEMIKRFGSESLRLSDKPELEKKVIHWALQTKGEGDLSEYVTAGQQSSE